MEKIKNRGFSLVELIIVIAIMAILIGVTAPLLMKYIERTNVSADTQLCDSVKEAILVAANDPNVLTAEDKSGDMINGIFNTSASGHRLGGAGKYGSDYLGCAFCKEVEDTLGFNPFTSDCNQYMKSTPAKNDGCLMVATSEDGNSIAIFIINSDSTGNRHSNAPAGGNFWISDLEASEMIYSK